MSTWINHYERGKYELRSSRPRQALRHFRKAQEVVEIDDNPLIAGALFMRMGAAEMACHQLDAALVAAQRAVAIAEAQVAEAEGKRLLVASTQGLAGIIALRGDCDRAVLMLRELLARIPDFNAPQLAAEPLELLSDMHLGLGNFTEAQLLSKQAQELRRKYGLCENPLPRFL